MAALQSAALSSIDRMTPYNIATTVWALGKLMRTEHSASSGGVSTASDQRAQSCDGFMPVPAASASNGNGSVTVRPAPDRPQLSLSRPTYPGAYGGYASSDSDSGAFSSGEDMMDGLTLAGLRQPARLGHVDAVSPADASQLLDGLGVATARSARQFKPAHVGDALWGFGCLRISPGDDAVSDLLSAAVAAPGGLQAATAACAMVGLAELAGLADRRSPPPWMTKHKHTLAVLATAAGGGFASLRAASTEQARRNGALLATSVVSSNLLL